MNTFRTVNATCQKPFGVFALSVILTLVLAPLASLQAADPNPGLDIPGLIYRGTNFSFTIYGAAPNKSVEYFCTSASGQNCGGFSLGNTDGKGILTLQRTMPADQEVGDYSSYVKVGTGISNTVNFSVVGSQGGLQWPTLPNISKVELLELKSTGYEGRVPNPERMSLSDSRVIRVLDSQGKPYPREAKNASGTIRAAVTINLVLSRADGTICSTHLMAQCRMGGLNLNPDGTVQIGIPIGVGEQGNPVPGDVILESVVAEAWAFADGTQQEIGSNVFTPGVKLFRVGDPPKIDSADKTAAKHDETITLTGANFDGGGAGEFLWANRILVDFDPNKKTSSRVINNDTGVENAVHYCSATKLKFEFPDDVRAGSHTVTIANIWGYSNPVTVNVSAGSGTPEDDPDCAAKGGVVSSITPTSGKAGTKVTITGKGFGSATSGANAVIVKLNGERIPNVSITKLDGSQMVVIIPNGATTGRITIKPAGRLELTGPIFTVTGSSGGGGTGGGGGGGGGGGSATAAGVNISSFSPDRIYIARQTAVLFEGTNFSANTVVSSDNPLVTLSGAVVNPQGTKLLVLVNAGNAQPGTVNINVASQGTSDAAAFRLENLGANAPAFTAVTINPSDNEGEVRMVISGNNLDQIESLEVIGLPNVIINNFSATPSTIIANVTVLDFDPRIFGWIKRAFAQTTGGDPAVVTGTTKDGATATIATDGSQVKTESQTPNNAEPQEPVPPTGFEKFCPRDGGIAKCVQQIYLISLGFGALVALLMIVLSGYQYMNAEGNAERVATAKDAFSSAFIGLIIIFIAFILLYLINPDLTQFNSLKLPPIDVKKP